MEYIISRFKYIPTIDFSDMKEQWIEMLGIKIHNHGSSDFIEVPPMEQIRKKLSEYPPDTKVLTDCRFFALLVGNLLKNPNSKSIFMMHYCLPSIDFSIPDNCHYITLDADIFVRNKENDDPIYIASNVMGSDQGQWIVEIIDKKSFIEKSYLGITENGPLYLSLYGWIERYQKCVKKYLNKESDKNDNVKKIYLGILSCLEKKYGIKVGVYKYKSCGTPYNILNFHNNLVI